MNKRDVTILLENGETLGGLVHIPDGEGKFPIIILVQGIGWDYHEDNGSHDEIAMTLSEYGFVIVQFNFSYQTRVTNFIDRDIPLDKRAFEVEQVVHWILQQDYIKKDAVGIYAMSFGVSTVLMMNLRAVRSLCFVGGLGFQPELFLKRYINKGAIINKAGETMLPRSNGKLLALGTDFWPSFDTLDQKKLVEKLVIPICVLHGDQDVYVDFENAKDVYARISSNNKKLKIFKGGDHGMNKVPQAMREEFLRDIVDWFQKTL